MQGIFFSGEQETRTFAASQIEYADYISRTKT